MFLNHLSIGFSVKAASFEIITILSGSASTLRQLVQMSSNVTNVINVIIMFLSTFWDDFPHTFLKSKPYSPCLDEVPGMLLQVVQLLHRLLQCQVLVHPVIIILINIVRIR